MNIALVITAIACLVLVVLLIGAVILRARRNEREETEIDPRDMPWNRNGEEERGPWGRDE